MEKQIAKAIKDYLVQLAVDDKLPLDMNGLKLSPIENIIRSEIDKAEADNPTCGGFNYEDVQEQAASNGTELTEAEAKDVIRMMQTKAKIPISWETIDYFIERYLEETKAEEEN